MTNITKASEIVKETLLGSEAPVNLQLSVQSKATFDKHARKDPLTGELWMGEQEFINAIAPSNEDFVSFLA